MICRKVKIIVGTAGIVYAVMWSKVYASADVQLSVPTWPQQQTHLLTLSIRDS